MKRISSVSLCFCLSLIMHLPMFATERHNDPVSRIEHLARKCLFDPTAFVSALVRDSMAMRVKIAHYSTELARLAEQTEQAQHQLAAYTRLTPTSKPKPDLTITLSSSASESSASEERTNPVSSRTQPVQPSERRRPRRRQGTRPSQVDTSNQSALKAHAKLAAAKARRDARQEKARKRALSESPPKGTRPDSSFKQISSAHKKNRRFFFW